MHKQLLTIFSALSLFFLQLSPCQAFQQIPVEGHFLSDSLKVGEVKAYSLSVTYPKEYQLVFPDSTYDFFPFEWVSHEWFPTRSDSAVSKDSAVYYLRSFEVDTVQYLSLPVFSVVRQDSIPLYATTDSLIFQHTVTQLPDSVVLKENHDFLPLKKDFNYWYLGIAIVAALLFIGLFILLFGKKLVRAYRVYKLKKRHQRFLRKFDRSIRNTQKEPTVKHTEKGLSLWKEYMEKLSLQPYASSTTKEILGLEKDTELNTPLKAIDRSIYGGMMDKEVYRNFEELKEFANRKFELRKEEIKNV